MIDITNQSQSRQRTYVFPNRRPMEPVQLSMGMLAVPCIGNSGYMSEEMPSIVVKTVNQTHIPHPQGVSL